MQGTRGLLSGKNQKGVALLIAVFCIVLITYIVTEVSYESNIEYLVNSQAISRLKAYYAARSGVELSLLRIKIYGQVKQQLGQNAAGQSKMLDMIWSFPFMWPPELPGDINAVDKDLIQSKVKESSMEASYTTFISDEGSKLDLNDLDSPSKGLREMARRRLTQIFEGKIQNDEAWAREHQGFQYQELVNNIIDWVDADQTSLNGGAEASRYQISDEGGASLPPNRGFRTVDELRMVAGMTDDYFDLLKDQVTVYGMKALNPNHASSEMLQSLDPSITPKIAAQIINRRDNDNLGGPYRDANDFWGFVTSLGARVDMSFAQQIPLVFDAVYNFRIKSVGSFANSTREINVIVFDIPKAASRVADFMKKENSSQGSDSNKTTNPTSPAPPQNTLSKGPPRIVYWNEK